MIILLALLPALVLCVDSAIDWKTCGISNKCMCQKDPLELNEYDYKETTVQQCDVGIQTIYNSEKRVVFLMQMKGNDANNLGSNPELALYNGPATGPTPPVKLFGCKMENGKVTLTGDKINDYKIKLFEEGDRGSLGDASYFKNGDVRCSILLERGKKIYDDFKEPSLKSSLQLVTATTIVYSIPKAYIYLQQSIKCPYFSFTPNPLVPKPIKSRPVMGTDKDVLNCANYGDSFAMRYDNISGSEAEIDRVECIKVDMYYTIFFVRNTVNATGHTVEESEKIVNPESYGLYCAAAMNEVCQKPMQCDNNDPKCPKFHAGSKGSKSRLECTGNKWLIKDQYYDVNTTVDCKRDEISESNEAVFFATLPTGQSERITDADRCVTEYDCEKRSHVRKSADTISVEGGVMRCKDEDMQLTIYDEETNVTMNGNSSYTCDKTDGYYKNGSFVVLVGSQAMCKAKPKEKVEAQPSISTAQGTMYAIVGAIAVIILIVAFQFLFYYCWSRGLLAKKNLKVTTILGKHYKDMPRSELIADCKEDFGQCLLATPDTDYLVLDGLKKIEMMLKEEVEDPDAWEEAYKFLLRFHGTIRRIDRHIWHMLSRYLYLETKKIIDKHGWRTREPIRNGNQKGLIRAVAVHLLSFSLHDRENYASEKLLVAGYLALGFHGASQYPHCGLLWSLVYHARPVGRSHKTDRAKRCHFSFSKLEDAMHQTAKRPCTIPLDQLIPAFGSVQHQAAFAIGAVPDLAYANSKAEELLMKTQQVKQEVTMGFFAGLCQSVMRNPIESVLSSLLLAKPNPKILERLHTVAPAEEWNAIAKDGERTMTYYGRHMDAKRLHERFMPTDKDTDFFKMQMEQKEFEDAVEKARSDLREWFAARTDKEEFKQKPAEFFNPAVRLSKFGDYVPPPPKKPAPKNAGSGSVSGSKSGSGNGEGGGSSGSNSSDGKSPGAAPPPGSEPKDGPAKAPPPSEPKDAAPAAAATTPGAPASN